MTAEFLAHPTIAARHGFFTRRGGVSAGPYASLNASLSSGDDPAHVCQNRSLVAQAMGVPQASLLGLRQVHGTRVIVAQAAWPEGEGPEADALVSRTPGLALGVITADCAPVLLHDAKAGVFGAAHAGWRGAAAGVLEATVQAMAELGADPARLRAVIGPCIGQASYEVGSDLRTAVLPTFAAAERFFRPGLRPERWQFDLAGYCCARLAAIGLAAAILARDTCAEPDCFYSHRRRTLTQSGPIGHQLSVIVVG